VDGGKKRNTLAGSGREDKKETRRERGDQGVIRKEKKDRAGGGGRMGGEIGQGVTRVVAGSWGDCVWGGSVTGEAGELCGGRGETRRGIDRGSVGEGTMVGSVGGGRGEGEKKGGMEGVVAESVK